MSPAAPPTVLHVCQEARVEALRFYKLAFGRCGLEPQIYVNFAKDIIYFGEKSGWENMLIWEGYTEDMEKIQYLAMEFCCMQRFVKWKLDACIDLKELLVVKPGRRRFRPGSSPLLVDVDEREEALSDRSYIEAISFCAKNLEGQKVGRLSREIPLVKAMMFVKTPGDGRYYC
jgi:2EXR family